VILVANKPLEIVIFSDSLQELHGASVGEEPRVSFLENDHARFQPSTIPHHPSRECDLARLGS
jgi:hypothetical protein